MFSRKFFNSLRGGGGGGGGGGGEKPKKKQTHQKIKKRIKMTQK